MNEPKQAICHCIIKHPSAAKFLAIKHADGWSPPVALVNDDQSIANQASAINQGLLQNYGFMTAVLRQLASSPGYRCLEVDMLSQHGREGLQAVWVGKQEYSSFRRSSADQYDPIAAWLDEVEVADIPKVRPLWEQPGWFAEAREWIQQSLKQLGIHQAGPVEQYRAFRTSSSILRVPAAGSHIYFKACMQSEPNEAALTQALAETWPELVPMPLKVDVQRNWMLSRDHGHQQQGHVAYEDFSEVARGLAEIQLGSADSPARWQQLGCPEVTLTRLVDFAANLESLSDLFVMGGGDMALSEQEVAALVAKTGRQQASLEKLAEYSIPNMLVHPDLWFTNIRKTEQGLSIYDWAGTTLAHPFFGLMKLIRFRELENEMSLPAQGDPEGDDALKEHIIASYLQPFDELESPPRLAEAFALVQEVYGLWRLFIWHRALAFEEPMSVSYQNVVRHLQRIGRHIVETS